MVCSLFLAQSQFNDSPQGLQSILFYLTPVAIGIAAVLAYLQHSWITPVKRLERILMDVSSGRVPRSFIIQGAPIFTKIAAYLEKLSDNQHRLTQQISEEESNLQAILRSMVEGVMIVDKDHVIREVNDAFRRQFSINHNPVHRTVLEVVRVVAIEEMVTETLRSVEPQSREISLDSYTPDQPPRYFDVSAVPIRYDLATAEEVVLVFHDISRLKQLEDVRREFVANVSHELRTPLSIFRGYLETLLDNPKMPSQELNRILEIMQKHSIRLNALVNDLLTLARLESRKLTLEPTPIQLELFVKQLTTDFRSKLEEHQLSIVVNIPADLPLLEADPFRVEQVLYNLLDNSIKYSNPHTSIQIKARVQDEAIMIQVSDDGIGIPPADIPHIFERFYRVDKARSRDAGGTGLGLSIVKHIVQLHHGRVEAQSELGKGTTITVYFPLVPEKIEK